MEHKAATMGVLFVFSFTAAILFLGMHRGHCARIVGGGQTFPHSRPYMAAIMRGDGLICGGTLIQRNWVLSAAHCKILIGDRVILGAHSLTKPEKEKQEFQVTRVICPKYFFQLPKENDIMLLQLNGRARITNSVRLVRLPTTNEDIRAGTQCLAVGWGRTATALQSAVLQENILTIFDRHDCQRLYPDPDVITANHLCAGVQNQRGGTCNGDSGGPLICGGIQRGISSFGPDLTCLKPAAYTRLTVGHIHWINNNMKGR